MMLCGYLQLTAPEFTVTFCSTVFIFYVITLAALFFSRHHLILRVSRVFRADNVYKSYNVESVSLSVFSYPYKYMVGL